MKASQALLSALVLSLNIYWQPTWAVAAASSSSSQENSSEAISSSGAPSSSSVLAASSTVTTTTVSVSASASIASSSSTVTSVSSGSSSASVSASSSTSASLPSITVDPKVEAEINSIAKRRVSNIISGLSSPESIPAWLSSLRQDGTWPDVDLTSGCDGQRANWPAQDQWKRISIMAGAWHGGLEGADQWVKDPKLRTAISSAMGYWFANDFTEGACLDNGGGNGSACPCGTPGLWNTNWFSNVIGIPELVGESCLLLNDTLSASELSSCSKIVLRAYGTFGHSLATVKDGITGANTLDVAKIGIDLGLLTFNVTMMNDAFGRIHKEVVVQQAVKADGIRPDGSFGQHAGIIYNGNYGKDYINDVLDFETEAAGTEFAANDESRKAVATLFDGDRWMIFKNTLTGVLHWDYSVIPRFISAPVADGAATAGLNINLTEVAELGNEWNSDALKTFSSSLNKKVKNANAGALTGNRVFYDNDYIVNRGKNYVSTLRMYSNRTQNTECTNSQNTLGFHLSDGTRYTYTSGNEYEDIFAAWDWNLIPGTTTDYANTPLNCSGTRFKGREAFVGGATTGQVGVAAMKYSNPSTRVFGFQKAWFFLPGDREHVMVAGVQSGSQAKVLSVLDQKKKNGKVVVKGNTLWHDSVGYMFSNTTDTKDATATKVKSNSTLPFSLHVKTETKTGNWSVIGVSTQPPAKADIFSAYIQHDASSPQALTTTPLAYTMYPGVSQSAFERNTKRGTGIQQIQNDDQVSAVYDPQHSIAMFVFWNATGGAASFNPLPIPMTGLDVTVKASGNLAVIVDLKSAQVTVSDPSQTLKQANVDFEVKLGKGIGAQKLSQVGLSRQWGSKSAANKTLTFDLPQSGSAGASVSKQLF